jgi:hypothetical protein
MSYMITNIMNHIQKQIRLYNKANNQLQQLKHQIVDNVDNSS